MKLQRTFILTLVCLFTLGLGIVSATEPEKIYPSPVRDVMATTGEIIAVDGDKVTVKGDGNYPVATVIVTDKTSVSYTHRRCRRIALCRSRWSPYH